MRRITATLALALAAFAAPASAFTFFDTGSTAGSPSGSLLGVTVTGADVGDSFQVFWDVDSIVLGDGDSLSANATYGIVSLSASQLVVDVAITNTTVLSATLTNAAVLSTGFGTSPNGSGSLVTDGSVFDQVGAGSGPQQTFPGGFKGIDVCVYAQNCSGGNVNSGLQAGNSDSFRVAVDGDFSGGSVDLLNFPVKFQTSKGSFEPAGTFEEPPIPEPSGALIFSAALLVLYGHGRMRRR